MRNTRARHSPPRGRLALRPDPPPGTPATGAESFAPARREEAAARARGGFVALAAEATDPTLAPRGSEGAPTALLEEGERTADVETPPGDPAPPPTDDAMETTGEADSHWERETLKSARRTRRLLQRQLTSRPQKSKNRPPSRDNLSPRSASTTRRQRSASGSSVDRHMKQRAPAKPAHATSTYAGGA